MSNYGESKRLGEIQVGESGLPFTILRPPIVYGPNDAATQLLFRQALALVTAVPWKSRPLSVMHAMDVAEALWLAVQRRPRGVTLPLEGPERTDTHALLRAIAAACATARRRGAHVQVHARPQERHAALPEGAAPARTWLRLWAIPRRARPGGMRDGEPPPPDPDQSFRTSA